MGRALDMILSGRIVDADEALAIGLLTEVVAPGKHLARAQEMAEGLAAFPQETMLADRRSALEGFGLSLERASLARLRLAAPPAASGSRVPPASPPARAAAAPARASSAGAWARSNREPR